MPPATAAGTVAGDGYYRSTNSSSTGIVPFTGASFLERGVFSHTMASIKSNETIDMTGTAQASQHVSVHKTETLLFFTLLQLVIIVLAARVAGKSRTGSHSRERVGQFVTVFFLPIFFADTGLRTNVQALDSAALWGWCALLIALAAIRKYGVCYLGAR